VECACYPAVRKSHSGALRVIPPFGSFVPRGSAVVIYSE
jgi:hypothetical protein